MKYLNKRIFALALVFVVMFAVIILRYFAISGNAEYADMALNYGRIKVEIDNGGGYIYDRNFIPLVNEKAKNITVTANVGSLEKLSKTAVDSAEFERLEKLGKAFSFESIQPLSDDVSTTTFSVPVRYGRNQIAKHLIGYTSDGVGVTGIESAYNRILHENIPKSSVEYACDGFGRVMIGEGKEVEDNSGQKFGVVTTIDYNFQKICEKAGEKIEKGAVVVSDVKSGDILALASFPDYDIEDISVSLTDKDCPLINRCLYPYSIGSIFKLVTACEAAKEGFSDFTYECTGSIDVCGKTFRCHKHSGHGEQNIIEAMTNSCNTYFIALSQHLNVESFRETAFTLGFGREIHLFAGASASTGILPTVKELSVPAELANFSFGQGKLSATPLHINQFTCAIANGGEMPILRVIRGLTEDGKTVGNEKNPQLAYTMDRQTAKFLKTLMSAAVNNSETTNAKPYNVMVGGKTSTAQTGRFDENGVELCNAWITGFFPVNSPKYAVTVLVEDGGYGNDAAAPIFREITEKIEKIEKSN